MISQNIKKQIIDQTNIVEVVGEVVQLTKKGSSYFGLCPFHNDNHPSMSVNNEKKMFNCFSCNTKGNVIYFMSRFHNITDDQATIMLAKRLGIEISEASTKEAIKQERLLKVMNDATLFYQFYLNNSEEGLEAKKYLFSRGIDEDIIKKLKIGLASSERNYLNLALKQKNHSELDQIELGLIKNDDTNTSYDVFRNRIIFPIENNNGQVVGFSGRIYRDNNQAKYINSSDNEIFHKGKILYHFHDAIPAVRENNKIIIFEGFMDVIAAIRANIHYGVATMGTALTNDHIKAILSLTKNIILCFDGDEAGIHAMKRSAMLFANYQIIPKAIVLPNNQDPDEYVKENGLDVGFAYDGDADRCIAVDENGNVVDGDLILYVCGKYMKEHGQLKDDTIVTTIMSNLGLYKACDKIGMKYEKTQVGDKYVYENMVKNGFMLGGEQSGHIIFSKHATTGDGILTSLMLMEVIMETKQSLGQLTEEVKIYPQLLKNVRVADKKTARENPEVVKAVDAVAEALGDDGRILVRESGTEPVIRVMVEAATDELCEKYVTQVIDVIEKEGLIVE